MTSYERHLYGFFILFLVAVFAFTLTAVHMQHQFQKDTVCISSGESSDE